MYWILDFYCHYYVSLVFSGLCYESFSTRTPIRITAAQKSFDPMRSSLLPLCLFTTGNPERQEIPALVCQPKKEVGNEGVSEPHGRTSFLVRAIGIQNELERRESNPQPPVLETGALPQTRQLLPIGSSCQALLSYAPNAARKAPDSS